MDQHKLKYYVQLKSGRDFVMKSSYDPEEIAWEAHEEACLMDDYVNNINPICDV